MHTLTSTAQLLGPGCGQSPLAAGGSVQRAGLANRRHAGVRGPAKLQAKLSHYEVLGVEADASADDIKAAFRRLAKELHPDINQQEGAQEHFMDAKRAYEVLSDDKARRDYDRTQAPGRMGFHFRDVDPYKKAADPWDAYRRVWEQEGAKQADTSRPGEGPEPSGPAADPAEWVEQLARVMGAWPDAPLRAWQSGRSTDPWGAGTSEAWHRRVDEQMRQPFQRGGTGYGRHSDFDEDDDRFNEWGPGRRRDDLLHEREGWRRPGHGTEWMPPQREDREQDEGRGGGGGGGGGRGGRDVGGRPPFRI